MGGKGIVEATFAAINTLFCQHVAAYTGSNTTLRGSDANSRPPEAVPHIGHRPLDPGLAPHRQLHLIRSIGTDASG